MRRYWIKFNKQGLRVEQTMTVNGLTPIPRKGWKEVIFDDTCCNMMVLNNGCTFESIQLEAVNGPFGYDDIVPSPCIFSFGLNYNGEIIHHEVVNEGGSISAAIEAINQTLFGIAYFTYNPVTSTMKVQTSLSDCGLWELYINITCER